MNVNRLEQTVSKLQKLVIRTNRLAAYNSTFAIGGVSCSADSFVVKESVVLRMNICAENPAHRKSAKRYTQPLTAPIEHCAGIKVYRSEQTI